MGILNCYPHHIYVSYTHFSVRFHSTLKLSQHKKFHISCTIELPSGMFKLNVLMFFMLLNYLWDITVTSAPGSILNIICVPFTDFHVYVFDVHTVSRNSCPSSLDISIPLTSWSTVSTFHRILFFKCRSL